MLGDILTPDLFAAAIRMATPLALAAIAGTISERSGVVNIGLEGMMLVASFAGVVVALTTGSTWLGVLGAVASAVLMAALHAFVSITLRADQVVSGTVVNILAFGLTGYLTQVMYGGTTDAADTLRPLFDFPLKATGVLGEVWRWIDVIFLSYTPLVYAAIVIAVVGQWAMFRTRWGLRLRALGEHPRAADTVGISVIRGRYSAVLLSGVLAGLAGANLSLEQVGSFNEGMTSGRGFIALAANIFGRWTPAGSYLASLLFGFADALQIKLQIFRSVGIHIPPQFFLMLPYVLTIVVLAGAMGRSVSPAALGKPYVKE